MTAKLFFVRHAAHDNVGSYLAGRMERVRLGAVGLGQAQRLGERMRRESFAAIIASPRDRTRETALAISDAAGIAPVKIAEELDEIDFGSWSGRSFDELNTDPAWRKWNENRGAASTPAGETMAQVQERIVSFATRIADAGGQGGRACQPCRRDQGCRLPFPRHAALQYRPLRDLPRIGHDAGPWRMGIQAARFERNDRLKREVARDRSRNDLERA